MPQFEEVIKWVLPRYYDPRYAKFIRVMRSSQPVHIASIASTNVGAAAGGTTTALCSTTFDAYTEGYVSAYGFSHSSTVAEMWFIDGTSTIVPQRMDRGQICQVEVPEAYFHRVDAGHTISAETDTTGTVCAWIVLQKFPVFDSVETESH